ncbi:DUF2306 domain-containing protein [Janthinobacterium sp. 17J80-10]|uniref:DUF2306 domain-containing protein n=1 Tax=Janthinobacterium sp. 17J80-10 TaxID=2497863 RepID=UPI0010059780|nr:DUF2306 domain-containing protein [Janthinobacterium sp. 17J80-10]QAU33769.1 DUF2306 domain-containing protein [Janthinobacterium sp. 17J80-10]
MMPTPAIAIHLAAALAALLLGGLTLATRKGTPRHRLFGRVWVLLMALAAISSFWIRHSGHLSWIHLLSAWVLVVLVMAVASIYKGNVQAHRRWVTRAYIGLAVAGVLALLPQRLLGGAVMNAIGLI